MIRFSWWLAAIVLAWVAVGLISQQSDAAPFLLRDAALLSLAAVALAAIVSPPPARLRSTALYAWHHVGRAISVAGAATALLGAGLTLAAVPMATIVWGIGVLLFLSGAWQAGAVLHYAAPTHRWERDDAGHFVRRSITGDPEVDLALWSPAALALLALILLAGAALRLWQLGALPAQCTGAECARVLALLNGQSQNTDPVALLAQALLRLTGDGLWSLRLSSVVVGVLTLPTFALAAAQMLRPAGVLLGAAMLAFSPWHIWASRSGEPWIVTPLLTAIVAWGVLSGLAGERRGWASAGAALGLLLVTQPLLWPAWLLILLLSIVFAVDARSWKSEVGSQKSDFRLPTSSFQLPPTERLLQLVGGAVAVGALAALPLWRIGFSSLSGWRSTAANSVTLTHALLHGSGLLSPDVWQTAALLAPWLAALVLAGLGSALAGGRRGLFLALALGGALLAVAQLDPVQHAPPAALLTIFTWSLLLATLALDQSVATIQRLWRRTLQPSTVTAAALLLVLLLGGQAILQLRQRLEHGASDSANPSAAAIARFVADAQDEGVLFVASQSVLNNPTVRLTAAAAIDGGRLQALNLQRDLPFTGQITGDLVFLLAPGEDALRQLVLQVYPVVQTDHSDEGRLLFSELRVAVDALVQGQGLRQVLSSGDQIEPSDTASGHSAVGPLHFAWGTRPPLPPPFTAQWQGSLVLAAAGDYRFVVEAAPGSLFSLLLDKRLVLDSSAGLTDHTLTLPAGAQQLEMLFRSGQTPGDLTVSWQPPNGELEPVPPHVLHSPPLPNIGLLGTYFAGKTWQGPALNQRKDWLIGPDATQTVAYSVEWQGKVAAPRAGDYLFGAVTDGVLSITVDGREIVNHLPGAESAESADDSAEGVIYLSRGWHAIDVRYAPQGAAPELKLYWQPPGSGPGPLSPTWLTPVTSNIASSDLLLPEAPALVDENLGADGFALAASIDLWRPQVRIPVIDLPPLLLENLWMIQGCGNALDQVAAPHGLAMNVEAGRLYVADTGNRRVTVLSMDGAPLGALQNDAFLEPVDVALAPDGSVLVLDAVAQQLVRFASPDGATAGSEGSLVPLTASFYRPRGLAVDALGIIYVADTGGGRIVVFEAGGQQLAQFGGQGTTLAAGQPVDVLATARALWSVSAEDGRLWQLNTLGSVSAIQRTDTINGPQLAGLPDGSFFVSDPARRTILYHAASGQPLRQFAYADTLLQPTGVAAGVRDDQLLLAVADTAACGVLLWQMPITGLGVGLIAPGAPKAINGERAILTP